MQQLTSGTLLHGGTYIIEKVLGQGSFGITYLAEHTSLGKKVAIKEFFMKELNSRSDDGSITGLTDGSLSYNYAQKFRKEAQNLAQMEHPNIVKVTDCFEENGTYYYVMEYIEGTNLNNYIKQYHPSEKKAVEIIRSVAEALIYMHEEKRMLHLDLKPGNIMRRKGDGHIFLIDFGLSKHYSNDGQPETSTTIGLGTVGYAPIEQANQTKGGEFRPTIDVYALGATLYKLLTGQTPPIASDLVSDDELLVESLAKHNVQGAIVDVIEKAMMPSVKKRTQSIRAFIDSFPNANKATSSATTMNNADTEETTYIGEVEAGEKTIFMDDNTSEKFESPSIGFGNDNKFIKIFAIAIIVLISGFFVSRCQGNKTEQVHTDSDIITDTLAYDSSMYYSATEEIISKEAVDLNLPSGVKWANINLGADNPWQFGNYYAWGGVEAEVNYDNYSVYKVNGKYNIVNTDRDAAHVSWGEGWRMPKYSEFEELVDRCTWEWSEWNGVLGYKVTGSNGNFIFLPAGGYKDNNWGIGTDGFYWSGELYRKEEGFAKSFNFNEDRMGRYNAQRSDKMAIRPVHD